MEKIIFFRNAKLMDLKKVIDIEKLINYEKFESWFSYNYEMTEEEINFLKKLISANELYLSSYNEQKLSMRFIAQILNKVDFYFGDVFDWYENEISCKINDFILKGKPYFIVANGIDEPEKPFFFLQEHKKFVNSSGNPEYQVLASMVTAIHMNNSKKIIGGFVIGKFWQFIILEKLENDSFEYFVSYSFDSLKIKDLEQIYKNLQAVKFLYCK